MCDKNSFFHKLCLANACLIQFFNKIPTTRIRTKPIYFTNILLLTYILNSTMTICEKATMKNVSRPMLVNTRVRYFDLFSITIDIIKIRRVPKIAPMVIGIIGKILLKHISRCQKCDMVKVRINKRAIFHRFGSK